MMIFPWILCFLSFSMLHIVYPKDRDTAAAAAAKLEAGRSSHWRDCCFADALSLHRC